MKQIAKATKRKIELDSLRPIKKEDEVRIMQKFRLDWNYHSNNLEGNSLTYGETKALILFGITAQGKPLKDHFEITGHDDAIKWVLDIVKEERPLTENFIRELHKLILKEPYEVNAITPEGNPTKKTINVGAYKKTPNHVRTNTGEIFRFASPEETPILMAELIDWYRQKENDPSANSIILAAEFHYKFIRIHPFDDGNGRTARILMNFILLKNGFPPVVIKTEDKEKYFSVLQQADGGNIEPFFEYIAKNLNDSLEIMIKGAQGKSVEEEDDIDREVALLERKLQNLSNPINQSRSLTSKLIAYDVMIAPLVKKYMEKCELFDKFYVKSSVTLEIANRKSFYKKEEILEKSKARLSERVNDLVFYYHHLGFNRERFTETNFTSGLSFKFDFTRIIIKSPFQKKTYEKLYGEELTKEESMEIIGSEVKRHKKAIEKLIDSKNK